MIDYHLGAKPDRFDPRDFPFRERVTVDQAKAAATTDRKFWTMVNKDFRINQGAEGTCVAHAATNLLLAGPTPHPTYPDFETEEKAHLFARALYLLASGDSTYQQGMYPRDACATLLTKGLIDSYWKVLQVEEIVTALLTFGPVMVTVPWYDSMFGPIPRYGNAYVKVNLETELAGYHEVALTGIDLAPDEGPPFFRIQNSWGELWGVNGTARISVEAFSRINRWDNWTFAEKPF